MNFSPRRTRSQDFIIFNFVIVAAVVVNLSARSLEIDVFQVI
jgi:hypothetical protein